MTTSTPKPATAHAHAHLRRAIADLIVEDPGIARAIELGIEDAFDRIDGDPFTGVITTADRERLREP